MTAAARTRSKSGETKARDVALELARQAGMTLEEWLTQAALPEEPDPTQKELARVGEALERLTSRIEAAEHRSTLAISGIDQSVLGLLSRLEGAERDQTAVAARFEGAVDELRTEQVRAEARLTKIEEDIASPKSLEAIRALETAIGKVAAHVYDADHRARDEFTALRGDYSALARRVEQLDARAAEPATPPAEVIDNVVTRIVRRLEQAEARTSSAIGALETSFADLDQRLRNTEHRNDDPEGRLEQLAADLARSFEETRSELAANLSASADGRIEALERSLKEMSEHVGSAERRSARAIESMGAEVVRMAETLGRRMEGVETRAAQAISQVGGEVARIADTVETRFRRADQFQAEALEKLGGEIARITERLADRIASSERRSAQAIDDVSEQVARVNERIGQRTERTSEDIAERIRQSEERTARLLEEAREKIDQRLAETQRRLTDQAPRRFEDEEIYRAPDLPPGPFGQEAFAPIGFEAPAEPPAPVARASHKTSDPRALMDAPELGAFEDPAFEDTAIFERPDPFTAAPSEPASVDAAYEPEPAYQGEPDLPPTEMQAAVAARSGASTRELIEQARAAARAAQYDTASKAGKAKEKSGSIFLGGFSMGKPRPKKASGVKKAVMLSATAAALGVSAFGYTLISAQSVSKPARAAEPVDATAEPPADAGPMAAVAVGPQLALPAAAALPPGAEANGLYADAVRRIEAKDFAGLADLRRAADLGHAQAQFYLAKLYEGGEAGLRKDAAEARRWTERAAQNGDRKAMHNLGLYYFEGTGGPKNATAAAQWFRRAADLGLLDSQFNLARLYEEGLGVGQNPAEAYKWYLVAGRSGDGESRAAAQRVKTRLSPQARSAAEVAAAAFRPDLPTSTAVATASAAAPAWQAAAVPRANVELAQRALSRLGYYRGPQDGASSPALFLAIQAYQRDNGLPATGAVDATLAARFTAVTG